MELILWRHAEAEEAEEGEPDAGRKLTSKGQKQAAKMARWLDSNLPETCRILVSPAVRTQETVAPLHRKFKTLPELGVGASIADVLNAANWPNSREPVLIVGHQPYLGLVAAQVLGTPQQECAVRKGNVWWITQKPREDELQTYLKAIMSPDLVVK
ncbi:SixA phosphatase family protein [Undibacterium sp.]|jgi:phosphohistidine phosphatase|uniref:SixA phosphatase family protein n=1 Tax=Undibacterium sp. TaxID=1914977 RepID=UPI002CB02332|nr:histidine phosphatase family protein [Undibacterium sp.]HTD02690.1 histidine phosphatase family protein [Undibacterium sp.]